MRVEKPPRGHLSQCPNARSRASGQWLLRHRQRRPLELRDGAGVRWSTSKVAYGGSALPPRAKQGIVIRKECSSRRTSLEIDARSRLAPDISVDRKSVV